MPRKPAKELATFGLRLREAIRASGMTRAKVLRELGMENATVRRWETGERNPQVHRVRELADFLGVRVADLTGDRGEVTVERDDAASPYAEVERLIADELAAGRPVAEDHLRELRGVRFRVGSVLSPYHSAARLLDELRAAERGRARPRRPVN